MTRQAPGTALSQAQWNRRPVAQRGQTPQLEQEWKATDDPNREVVPGEMRSDREEIPAGFTKADADKAETMEAALTGSDGAMRALVAPGCQVYWPAPYEVCGAIRDKYNALGGPNSFLLFPKTNEITNPDGIGKRTEFQNGPIYWSPQGGAHPVVNHFLAAWARSGYENGIGYPTTDEIVNPDGIGRRQHFTGATIYWRLNEAHFVGGAIADKWHSLGAERADGALGYPLSDERTLPDGVGRMNRFERGVIYWHPSTGAHAITGGFLQKFEQYQWERGLFGYPVSDAMMLPDGVGARQNFQNLSVYSHPTAGTHPIGGRIGEEWHQRGAESGPLGYPTTDEIDTTAIVQSFGDRMVGFQGGVLLYSFESNAVLEGNWHLYSALDTPGPTRTTEPVKRELITKEVVERMESEMRPLATRDCPSEALHPNSLQEYNCERAVYMAGKGVWVPFRRGRTHGETGTGGFGINHAFYDHDFNIHWAERILQSSADYNLVDISYDPVTQRSNYMWKTGAEFSVMSGGKRHYIEALEVIIEPGPPGTVQVPIDNASMGLITGFCRQKDRNGTVLPKCPDENMPGPFKRTEYDAYDWAMGY